MIDETWKAFEKQRYGAPGRTKGEWLFLNTENWTDLRNITEIFQDIGFKKGDQIIIKRGEPYGSPQRKEE